jgi:class 3 adenylate cyclase
MARILDGLGTRWGIFADLECAGAAQGDGSMTEPGAFLEVSGRRIPLTSSFKIGRSRICSLTLYDEQASREHALIAYDEGRSAWLLMDLGSTNGTRLNGVLVGRPTVLRPGDQIRIGSHTLGFYDPAALDLGNAGATTSVTLVAVDSAVRWLLLADVRDSTRLSAELPQEELSRRIRLWVRECEAIIEAAGGRINEYLGDGFLAVWSAGTVAPEQMVEALRSLEELVSEAGLDFRFVVHRAEIQSGAGVSSGIEKLAGKELNFLFKAEKATAAFDRRLLLTRAASDALSGHATFEPVGRIEVAGFGGEREFLELEPPEG